MCHADSGNLTAPFSISFCDFRSVFVFVFVYSVKIYEIVIYKPICVTVKSTPFITLCVDIVILLPYRKVQPTQWQSQRTTQIITRVSKMV